MSAREAASETTPLAAKLAARIRREGPISVADYMDACLNDREYGYYRKSNAIGRGGDFITAPEISQVFGELIGLWCAVVWQGMAAPKSVRLVELGPGRGTLMRDALRAARADPAFRGALDVRLVESNAALEAMQRTALAGEDVPIGWSAGLEPGSAPAATIVIANEFLDTLPVAQWVFRKGHWHSRLVGLGDDGALCFTAGATNASLTQPAQDGDILESRTAALAGWAEKLAAYGAPLAALFIDYGHPRPALGDTLQAVAAHRYDDPLRAPGEVDLSAQVDFAAVADAMRGRGLTCDGPVSQAQFLSALGIVERASRLMAANPQKAATIEAGVARLLAPSGMGTRFCALGVRSESVAPLPGFEPVDIERSPP
jgi:NADH dehydrogenase [ubiquinone] 1 alpha subcomplex assembly factor 7